MSDRLTDEQVDETHLWADLEVMASHVSLRLHALTDEVQASRKTRRAGALRGIQAARAVVASATIVDLTGEPE